MTRVGKQMIIDALAMQVFDVDERIAKLNEDKKRLQTRIMELEAERDLITPVVPIVVTA